jgi:glycosyltransferase involved in cell wall biosynthesis
MRDHIRVLHVVEAFGGGVYEIVRHLATRHAEAGHIVAIAYGVRPETPADLRAEIPPSVELIPLPWTDRSIGAQVRSARRLRRIVPAWKPDVVHLHSSFATIIGAAVVPKAVPTVASPHAYSFTMESVSNWHRRIYQTLESWAARRVGLIGAVSESEADIARSIGGHHVRVVANGIPELDDITIVGPPPSKIASVIAMGRAEPQRQPEQCVEILSSVSDFATVQWVGSASTTDTGVQQLTDAGIPVTGWLPRESALQLLSDARAYLHWTAWDGQPLSVLEAMARDTVVIASDIPPNREILGETQVFRTIEEASAHLQNALQDDGYAAQLIENQRLRRTNYSTRRMAQEWLDVYRNVLNGTP